MEINKLVLGCMKISEMQVLCTWILIKLPLLPLGAAHNVRI